MKDFYFLIKWGREDSDICKFIVILLNFKEKNRFFISCGSYLDLSNVLGLCLLFGTCTTRSSRFPVQVLVFDHWSISAVEAHAPSVVSCSSYTKVLFLFFFPASFAFPAHAVCFGLIKRVSSLLDFAAWYWSCGLKFSQHSNFSRQERSNFCCRCLPPQPEHARICLLFRFFSASGLCCLDLQWVRAAGPVSATRSRGLPPDQGLSRLSVWRLELEPVQAKSPTVLWSWFQKSVRAQLSSLCVPAVSCLQPPFKFRFFLRIWLCESLQVIPV
jgi:hypothetical protein